MAKLSSCDRIYMDTTPEIFTRVCVCVCALSCSVVFGFFASLWTVARLLCPWNFPGKNTGVGCHFLLQGGLPEAGIEPGSLMSSALVGGFFTTEPPLSSPLQEKFPSLDLPCRSKNTDSETKGPGWPLDFCPSCPVDFISS